MFSQELIDRLKNVHTYAVTPFADDNLREIDLEAFSHNIEFLIESGVRVIAVGGGTGEIEALANDELEMLARIALEVTAKRALVITCVPGNIKGATQLVSRYEALGAEVVLSMPPLIRGKIPTDLEGVFEYYQLLATASDLPMMPYKTQAWPAEFFVRLSEIDRIIGIKDPCHVPHGPQRAISAGVALRVAGWMLNMIVLLGFSRSCSGGILRPGMAWMPGCRAMEFRGHTSPRRSQRCDPFRVPRSDDLPGRTSNCETDSESALPVPHRSAEACSGVDRRWKRLAAVPSRPG